MTITPKSFPDDLALPLPIQTSVEVADVITDDGEPLTITLGLDTKAIASFTHHACNLEDAELQRFTTDYKRICENGYEAWYAKERYPYGLVNAQGELAALIWFGPKDFPLPDETMKEKTWHTFAIRTYPPYRGKRLAFPFSEAVFALHAKLFPQVSVWLDTVTENEGAIRLYKKLGFIEAGQTTEVDASADGRLVMTRI